MQSARGALNLSGQRLTGTERLHLLAETPVWRASHIPVAAIEQRMVDLRGLRRTAGLSARGRVPSHHGGRG